MDQEPTTDTDEQEPTPGPWDVVDEALIATEGYPGLTDSHVIAEMRHAHKEPEIHERVMANARLIAAAPDLRDALEEIYRIASTVQTSGEGPQRLAQVKEKAEDALEAAGVEP